MGRFAPFISIAIALGLCASSAHGQGGAAFGISDPVSVQIDGLPQGSALQLKGLLGPKSQFLGADGLWEGERDDLTDALATLKLNGNLPPDFQVTPLGPSGPFGLRDMVSRTYEPSKGVAFAESKIKQIEAECSGAGNQTLVKACRAKRGLPGYERMLASLNSAEDACDDAARQYYAASLLCGEFGCSGEQSGGAFKAFDDECLHSMAPWRHPDGQVRADPVPNALTNGGLKALAYIEVLRGGVWIHHCSGLLLRGNRLLTARHCFDTILMRKKLKEGAVRVRLLRGADDVWPLLWSPDVSTPQVGVVDDRLVLSIEAPTEIAVPDVVFATPTTPSDAVVASHFVDFDRGREADDPEAIAGVSKRPLWQRGLRWAGRGMCFAVEADQGCVRILCQTVPGYSGAPIIAASSDPQGRLVVYGIISGPDQGQDARCGEADLVTTLAASAVGISP